MTMKKFLRDNGLSLGFLAIFVVAFVGQSVAGFALNNEERAAHRGAPVGYLNFVTSSQFFVDVAENWQSEFLQFSLFILGTVWLVQRGSPESKEPGEEGVGTDAEQFVGRHARPDSPAWARTGGIRQWLYSNSLLLAMGAIFVLSWLAQSLAGVVVLNAENAQHDAAPLTWGQYLASADFWARTLQNWQSEFLAVGAMVAFAIYLRQRGSSESKPVGLPHTTTAVQS